jgi:hypothetical protein
MINPRRILPDTFLGLAGLAVVIVVVLIGVAFWHFEYGTEHNVTFTVKSLDDQSSGSSHKYLIMATDGTVYEDTDSWLHGKTDSSNIYAWMTVGDTYDCPVYGWRNFISSSYEDVLDGCVNVTPGVPESQTRVP